MKRVFSGVQPTGQIHLGNYITMRNFIKQQDDKDCFYCVVDLHSVTVPQDPKELKKEFTWTGSLIYGYRSRSKQGYPIPAIAGFCTRWTRMAPSM